MLWFATTFYEIDETDSTLFIKTRPQESRTRKTHVDRTMKIHRMLPSLVLATALTAVSCGKLEDRINTLEQRIAELEDTVIPFIDTQMASINKTIGDMDRTDAALKEYISSL